MPKSTDITALPFIEEGCLYGAYGARGEHDEMLRDRLSHVSNFRMSRVLAYLKEHYIDKTPYDKWIDRA